MLERIKNYFFLIRFHKPTGSLLLFYPILFVFLLLDPLFIEWKLLILFAIAAFSMRSSGCIINDLWDIKYDKLVKRTMNRPLANGSITKIEAFILLFILLSSALLLLIKLPYSALIFAVSLIVPIVIYPLMKRFFKYPQLFLGLTFNSGIFVAWLSLEESVTYDAYLIYFAFVFLTIAYDTIYAHQDIDDDLKIGVKSTAISFGKCNYLALNVCYILFILLVLILGMLNGFGLFYFISLQILGMYILLKLRNLNLKNSKACGEFFNFNNYIIFILAIIFIICNYLKM